MYLIFQSLQKQKANEKKLDENVETLRFRQNFNLLIFVRYRIRSCDGDIYTFHIVGNAKPVDADSIL